MHDTATIAAQGDGFSTEAMGLFRQALDLAARGQDDKAVALYQAVVLHEPSFAPAWSNLGQILRKNKQYEAALACAARAIELDPNNPVLLSNYGGVLAAVDRKDEAIKASRASADMAPEHPEIRMQHAITLREMGLAEEAQPHFEAACAMAGHKAEEDWEMAINLLILGRWKEAWPLFENRWHLGKITLHEYAGVPRWQGEDVAGKTVLVYEEQGYGDTMLCARYLCALKERGARVIFEATEPLERLMRTCAGVDKVILRGTNTGEPCDFQTPIMSLPGIFGTMPDTIPAVATFNSPAAIKPEVSRLLEIAGKRLKVGILWSGRPGFAMNNKRAVPLSRFLPLAEIPNVQLFSLQKGAGEEALANLGLRGCIYELAPHIQDFADTAAIIRHLDLIVMTDSGLAHLAGSLGVPVWDLLCYRPYWIYGQEGEECAWYPSMRLMRQPEPGDWDSVFEKVAQDIAALAKARG